MRMVSQAIGRIKVLEARKTELFRRVATEEDGTHPDLGVQHGSWLVQ
jgi:hypothetical protein